MVYATLGGIATGGTNGFTSIICCRKLILSAFCCINTGRRIPIRLQVQILGALGTRHNCSRSVQGTLGAAPHACVRPPFHCRSYFVPALHPRPMRSAPVRTMQDGPHQLQNNAYQEKLSGHLDLDTEQSHDN